MSEFESLIRQIELTKKREGRTKHIRYNKWLKKRVVKLVEQVCGKGKLTKRDIANKLGLDYDIVHRWVKEFGDNGASEDKKVKHKYVESGGVKQGHIVEPITLANGYTLGLGDVSYDEQEHTDTACTKDVEPTLTDIINKLDEMDTTHRFWKNVSILYLITVTVAAFVMVVLEMS